MRECSPRFSTSPKVLKFLEIGPRRFRQLDYDSSKMKIKMNLWHEEKNQFNCCHSIIACPYLKGQDDTIVQSSICESFPPMETSKLPTYSIYFAINSKYNSSLVY
jgi:hypothetical protein